MRQGLFVLIVSGQQRQKDRKECVIQILPRIQTKMDTDKSMSTTKSIPVGMAGLLEDLILQVDPICNCCLSHSHLIHCQYRNIDHRNIKLYKINTYHKLLNALRSLLVLTFLERTTEMIITCSSCNTELVKVQNSSLNRDRL